MHSEVARIKQEIETTYLAGKLGLTGLQYGAGKHEFIEKRTANLGKLNEQLQELIGETAAMELFVETMAKLPSLAPRPIVLLVLQEESGDTIDTAVFADSIEYMWKTIDRLVQRFGKDDAHKIVYAG